MASFCLPPSPCIFLPNFRSRKTDLVKLTPFWILRTTHLSKPGLVEHGACVECIRSQGRCRRSCFRPSLMTTRAIRGDTGDKRIHVLDQERLVCGDEEKVQVPDGGLEATLNRLSKWLVAATISLMVIWRHDAQALWLLMVSPLNTILSFFLKQVLNQDRPAATMKSDPGMPSSHAQSIFFAATLVIISMMNGLGVNMRSLVLSAVVFAIGLYLSWLRVSQQFHTFNQVLVGAILGSAFSIFSFWSWNAFIQEAYTSRLWVRVCLAIGAAGFPLSFVAYVIRHWLK